MVKIGFFSIFVFNTWGSLSMRILPSIERDVIRTKTTRSYTIAALFLLLRLCISSVTCKISTP
ncbi:uncharacterized protein G2W53_032251 [Senna tora]|uniref:Uncharacterized protein n=1 Tax=Senna tora TaxID=362788 RepID=A0A834SYJ1_9FABA|nr:uncharacterized protein G2W53_032251 [Senna tora]